MIRLKSVFKSFGVSIVTFCAVFLTYLFQSFRLDLQRLDIGSFNESQRAFYDAQITQSNMMLAIALGVLGLFAIITLFFAISKFIKDNQPNMGILKAMGYERKRIAVEFTKFSLTAIMGSVLAIGLGAIIQPFFYQELAKGHMMPDITIAFHPVFLLGLLFLPAVVFAIASYLIAYFKLAKKPLDMIKGGKSKGARIAKEKSTYLKTLRAAIFKNHIALIIFVGFSALSFGSAVQMSFSLESLNASPLFFWLMFGIGLILGVSILYLAFGFTYTENKEYVSLMKGYGYRDTEIITTLYGAYVIVAIIGFAIGTAYQYGLIYLIIDVFSTTAELEYTFSFPGLAYTLLIFVPVYLLLNYYFYLKLKKLSVKEALSAE